MVLKHAKQLEVKGSRELEVILVFARVAVDMTRNLARSIFFSELGALIQPQASICLTQEN